MVNRSDDTRGNPRESEEVVHGCQLDVGCPDMACSCRPLRGDGASPIQASVRWIFAKGSRPSGSARKARNRPCSAFFHRWSRAKLSPGRQEKTSRPPRWPTRLRRATRWGRALAAPRRSGHGPPSCRFPWATVGVLGAGDCVNGRFPPQQSSRQMTGGDRHCPGEGRGALCGYASPGGPTDPAGASPKKRIWTPSWPKRSPFCPWSSSASLSPRGPSDSEHGWGAQQALGVRYHHCTGAAGGLSAGEASHLADIQKGPKAHEVFFFSQQPVGL